MTKRLSDIVQFRGDRLFNGAVSIDWFGTDEARTRAASEAFVFHGPAYHGVKQEDVGTSHGHQLQDTVSFTLSLLKRFYGFEDQPFTLAIAGYGTGKSHLGLTLASLLQSGEDKTKDIVLTAIERADQAIGAEIRAILREAHQPCLVVALNGTKNVDLTNEVTKQLLRRLKRAGLDTHPLDNLRPRFSLAANLIKIAKSNVEVVNDLLEACDADTIDDILSGLDQQDETVYKKVHQVLESKGFPISAVGGESIRDVIDIACKEYCGSNKPFKSLVILFDEFGRYMEFATIRSHIAGSGVLQDLFEGVQAKSGLAFFAGFIQFDLNAYVERIAREHRNEILRYVTRYQNADRRYLSINLETLIANLIEKKEPSYLTHHFDGYAARQESTKIAVNLRRWYPNVRNHRLWNDDDQFHSLVRKGCWPLSAYSTWFLFHLAAAGKHLQERSALALLGDVFQRYQDQVIGSDLTWNIAPADFWSDALEKELTSSEEGGHLGSIACAYASVEAKHGANLPRDYKQLLRAIVLASKIGLKAVDKNDAIEALAALAGLPAKTAYTGIVQLQDEYNVIGWDDSYNEFDIISDGIPKTQFLSFLRQRVNSVYDEEKKARLFIHKAAQWCDQLNDISCDFSDNHRISTQEWFFKGVTTEADLLDTQIKMAAERWSTAVAADEPRGTIIYCYLKPHQDLKEITSRTEKQLRAVAVAREQVALPILVVFLHDEEGELGQALAEFAILEDHLTQEDRERFGNLIGAQRKKLEELIRSHVAELIKRREYVTALNESIETGRLGSVGSALFNRIYQTPLLFPFDGFKITRGNAADSCKSFVTELLHGKLDWDAVQSKPKKDSNRAVTLLKDTWDVFAKNGKVRSRPGHLVLRSITESWDEALASEGKIAIGPALRRLCAPPFGANLASAGMFLGVFVAARIEKLNVIHDGSLPYAVHQWATEEIFQGKFLDLDKLKNAVLVRTSGESSEWQSLLDEWEEAESHSARRGYLDRAEELKKRIPLPPTLIAREEYLRKMAEKSKDAIREVKEKVNEAIYDKVERGIEKKDVGRITWGAADLKALINKMLNESPLWSQQEIKELEPHYSAARQSVIQYFDDWLERQWPKSQAPDDVGKFKHIMLDKLGGNLRSIGLDEQFQTLTTYTQKVVSNAEVAADAKQTIQEVRIWMTSHQNAIGFPRAAELRSLQQVAKQHVEKLQDLAARLPMKEIVETRIELTAFLEKIKTTEKNLMTRAKKLWESRIQTKADINRLHGEVDALVRAFENCAKDLEDLKLMSNALKLYENIADRITDPQLTWPAFEKLARSCETEAESAVGDDELPWPPNTAVAALVADARANRMKASESWIGTLAKEAESVAIMTVDAANRLHNRASAPPAILSDEHTAILKRIVGDIEARLNNLKIEWLVAKYLELDQTLRKEFLLRVSRDA